MFKAEYLKIFLIELGEDCLISWIKVMEKFAASRPGNDLWCSKKGIE
ncbi:hypothetical protein CLCAR_1818 [Clostridium carboxidivorans P7]|nr:hypothetical protein [Clostridium carboxidivorans]EFG88596.1 hypothetical protein CLCAR_1818 [Clostridium carboxidivorans P7]